jgi:hypothetical protein
LLIARDCLAWLKVLGKLFIAVRCKKLHSSENIYRGLI